MFLKSPIAISITAAAVKCAERGHFPKPTLTEFGIEMRKVMRRAKQRHRNDNTEKSGSKLQSKHRKSTAKNDSENESHADKEVDESPFTEKNSNFMGYDNEKMRKILETIYKNLPIK